jgi:steroid delta-isomerase-like uncharacterized protein
MTIADPGRLQTRLAVVDEHLRAENSHDLNAIMATFGDDASFADEPWGDRRQGRDGVRSYYTEIMSALPDLAIDVMERHAAAESVVLEVTIRGTHLGPWRGLPATGRRVAIPLCAVYLFDSADRLLAERVYYDRAAVLRQLGMFHEPLRGLGRIVTALSHPVTLARAYLIRPSRRMKGAGPRAA